MTQLLIRLKFITTVVLFSLLVMIIFSSCSKNDSASIPADQTTIEKIAPTALVGFWKFDGNPNDASGHGNNGVVTTRPYFLWSRNSHLNDRSFWTCGHVLSFRSRW